MSGPQEHRRFEKGRRSQKEMYLQVERVEYPSSEQARAALKARECLEAHEAGCECWRGIKK